MLRWSLSKGWIVFWYGLAAWLGGCSSFSGRRVEQQNWDFSSPFHTHPPARSPESFAKPGQPHEGLFTLFAPLSWWRHLSPQSGGTREPSSFAPSFEPRGMMWASHNDTNGGDHITQSGVSSAVSLLFSEAESALAENRNQLAEHYLEQAILCDPEDPAVWKAAAVVALRANQPQMASSLVSRALERFPTSVGLWQLEALAQYRMGDFPRAEKAARKAISLDNRQALSYFLVGAALQQQGQSSQAEVYFRRAAQLDLRFAPSGLGK